MGKNRLLSIGFSVLLLITISAWHSHVVAQDADKVEKIVDIDNTLPDHMMWTPDSQTLMFEDSSTISSSVWYVYSVETGALTLRAVSTLQPQSTQTGCSNSEAYSQEDQTWSSISPNSKYSVRFVSLPELHKLRSVITNCQTDESYVVPDELLQVDRILWSDDSNAFVTVSTIDPVESWGVRSGLVSDYTKDVSGAILRILDNWMDGDQSFVAKNVYDISSNGDQVLLRVVNNSGNFNLYLYDAARPSQSHLIENLDASKVIAASYSPGDETRLWVVNEDGLVQYDLVTNEKLILNSSFTSTAAEGVPTYTPALFSPNGRYLAILQHRGLYFVDLSKHVPQTENIIPAPTAESSGLLRLHLVADCPTRSSNTIVWHILNPNPEMLAVQWQEFIGTPESNTVNVSSGGETAPGDATFETPVQPPRGDAGTVTTVSIFVDGDFHDQRTCYVPRQ